MRVFWALLPVAVTLMLFLLHAHAILRPSDTQSSLMHHLLFLSGPALVWVYFKTDRHRGGNGAAARQESGGWMS
jgi:hypothetical protein